MRKADEVVGITVEYIDRIQPDVTKARNAGIHDDTLLAVSAQEPVGWLNIHSLKFRPNPLVKMEFINASTVAGPQEIALYAKLMP